MANRLRFSPEYLRAREDPRMSARLLLRFGLEPRIAADPDSRGDNRFEVILGGHLAVAEKVDEADLLIFFHRVNERVVQLDLIVDLLDPPDWFLNPTGTWAEQLVEQTRDLLNGRCRKPLGLRRPRDLRASEPAATSCAGLFWARHRRQTHNVAMSQTLCAFAEPARRFALDGPEPQDLVELNRSDR
jgi:anaerobic selenocysteine-containing dehydrogenase